MFRTSLLRPFFSFSSLRSTPSPKLIISQQHLKSSFKPNDKPQFAYGTRHIVFPQNYKPYKINFTTDVFMWGMFALFYFMCWQYVQKYNKMHELEGVPKELR